jgi:hypothetical protein
MTTPARSQYQVLFEGTVIETTGYISTLSAARSYVKQRYNNTYLLRMELQPIYPQRGPVYPVLPKATSRKEQA